MLCINQMFQLNLYKKRKKKRIDDLELPIETATKECKIGKTVDK